MSLANMVLIQDSFKQLKNYCENESFKGWDPYDGLNSKLFQSLRLNKVRFFRLGWTELFKRNPINFRNIAHIEKEYNPKGLGLFLTGYCNLYSVEKEDEYLEKIIFLADKLIELQSQGYSGSCWGYNFDWQSRAFFLPKETPTLVATSFVSYALLDAYEITGNQKYLDIAISSTKFILNDLNRTQKERGFIFSDSPYDNTCVYNTSLLGSKLLARVYSYTKDKKLLISARASIQAIVEVQREDGAWIYGELDIQSWVDSFHTGYNLEAIYEYQKYSGDNRFDSVIEKGLKYYIENFFLEDGTPKYYDTQTYPIDIHSPAQFIVTLSRLDRIEKHKELVDRVIKWTIINMQDKQGYFYYQLKKSISSKIPYMRWAEAWVFYAFSFYFKSFIINNTNDSDITLTNINNIKIYSFQSKSHFLEELGDIKKILIAINAEKIVKEDNRLKEIINNNIGYTDGIGAVIALKGRGVKSVKIPGSEFWLDIIKKYQNTKTFYLIGSSRVVIESTIKRLKQEYPNIKILGYRDGFISNWEKKILKIYLRYLKPDIVYIAQGTPKQEFLMDELFKIHPALYMGLGGSFDIYAGEKKRAPKIFLNFNLEWLYRLLQEPTRFKRQRKLVKFLFFLKDNSSYRKRS